MRHTDLSRTVATVLAVWAATTDQARAWKYENFFSGMTEEAAALVFQRKGFGSLTQSNISSRPGAYVLANRSTDNVYHLELCRGVVHGISIQVGKGFITFAMRVEKEKSARGEPDVKISQIGITSPVWASWNDGDDELEYIYGLDLGDKDGGVELKWTAPNKRRG